MRWWSTLVAGGRVLPKKYMLMMRRQLRVQVEGRCSRQRELRVCGNPNYNQTEENLKEI